MGDHNDDTPVNNFLRYIFVVPPRDAAPRDLAILAMMCCVALMVSR